MFFIGCIVFLSGCNQREMNQFRGAMGGHSIPTNGYIYITASKDGYKWYIAPESKAAIQIEGRNPVTGKTEINTFTSISIFISYPYGMKSKYSVEAFACDLLPGTFVKQNTDRRGWDRNYTTEPYGTIRWQIWQKVCKGEISS